MRDPDLPITRSELVPIVACSGPATGGNGLNNNTLQRSPRSMGIDASPTESGQLTTDLCTSYGLETRIMSEQTRLCVGQLDGGQPHAITHTPAMMGLFHLSDSRFYDNLTSNIMPPIRNSNLNLNSDREFDHPCATCPLSCPRPSDPTD
ncbi:unnamed protein product [Protopolystoma xenopodis]|uniref:Uncharacterized protein n=1 Tax=Protopolystoma xenopodis TaxID=117903 RepID=A0A3S5ADX0_9PLAT|nr:unnamed protein product [Protopolystoma xenopodis]